MRRTYSHCELVIREESRHSSEKMLVVFTLDDSLQSELLQFRFDRWREFAFDFPVFFCDGDLERIEACFELVAEPMVGGMLV